MEANDSAQHLDDDGRGTRAGSGDGLDRHQRKLLSLAAWLDYQTGQMDASTLTGEQLTALCGETLRHIEQMRAALRETSEVGHGEEPR